MYTLHIHDAWFNCVLSVKRFPAKELACAENASAVVRFLWLCCFHELVTANEHSWDISIGENSHNALYHLHPVSFLQQEILHQGETHIGK